MEGKPERGEMVVAPMRRLIGLGPEETNPSFTRGLERYHELATLRKYVNVNAAAVSITHLREEPCMVKPYQMRTAKLILAQTR